MSIASITFSKGAGQGTEIHFLNGEILDDQNKKITDNELSKLTQGISSITVTFTGNTNNAITISLTDNKKNKRLQQALKAFQQNPTSSTGPSKELLNFAIADDIANSIGSVQKMFDTTAIALQKDKIAQTLQTEQLLNTIADEVGKLSVTNPSEAAKAAKDLAEAINAAKDAGVTVTNAQKALGDSLKKIATNIQSMSNPSEAAKAAKDLVDAIKTAKGAKIDVSAAQTALEGSLNTIATNIQSMSDPSEAAKAAKDLAEAINAAKDAGVTVTNAQTALEGSLNTIATNIQSMSDPSEAEAIENLGVAIKTAGLGELKDIGNAGIMCQLVTDKILTPDGNGIFTVGESNKFPKGTKSKIWLDDKNNDFQMDITGTFDEKLIESLKMFKKTINDAFNNPSGPIKIDPEALAASLNNAKKALEKNAFVFYDFSGEPPIMFTQRKNHFGKLESSVSQYENDAWHKAKKQQSKQNEPDLGDIISQQRSNNNLIKISTNKVTNSDRNDAQWEALLGFLRTYRS
jgi:uncharacterized protein YqgV (UPF0045/DUF77 family)